MFVWNFNQTVLVNLSRMESVAMKKGDDMSAYDFYVFARQGLGYAQDYITLHCGTEAECRQYIEALWRDFNNKISLGSLAERHGIRSTPRDKTMTEVRNEE